MAARENARGYEVVATQTTITRSAPLPSAEELFEYESVIPGGAERILKMAENQSSHRIELEKLIVVNQQKQSWRGQNYGFIIGLTGILMGAALSCLGHEMVGALLAGTTVTGLVSLFVIGQHRQSKDLADKHRN